MSNPQDVRLLIGLMVTIGVTSNVITLWYRRAQLGSFQKAVLVFLSTLAVIIAAGFEDLINR